MDPIGADQQGCLGGGGVGELGEHLAVVAELVGVQALAVLDLDPASPGLLTQHPLQQAALEGSADGAVLEPDAVGHLPQAPTGAAPQHGAWDTDAVCMPDGVDVQGVQHVQTVEEMLRNSPA